MLPILLASRAARIAAGLIALALLLGTLKSCHDRSLRRETRAAISAEAARASAAATITATENHTARAAAAAAAAAERKGAIADAEARHPQEVRAPAGPAAGT